MRPVLLLVLLATAASAQDRSPTRAEVERMMREAEARQREVMREIAGTREEMAAEDDRQADRFRAYLVGQGMPAAEVEHHVACLRGMQMSAALADERGGRAPSQSCGMETVNLAQQAALATAAADRELETEARAAEVAAAPTFTSVAIDAQGRWAVGSTHRDPARPRLATAPDLSPTRVEAFSRLGGLASLALGPEPNAAVTGADGVATLLRYGGCDYPHTYGVQGTPARPARIVLDPAGCDWLVDDGREVWASDAWTPVARLAAGAEARLVPLAVPGSGLIWFGPDGRVVGGRPPAALAAAVRAAHAATGDIQSLAVDGTGRGPEGQSGVVVVGTRGFRARYVDPALCAAIEAVTGFDGGDEACVRNPEEVRAERLAEVLPPIPWPDTLPRERALPLDG